MAKYEEEFTTHGQRFLLRNARGEDAQAEIAHIEQMTLETDFLTWLPGEYSRQFKAADEAEWLKSTVTDEDMLYLFAFTTDGELVGNCSVSYGTNKARLRHLGDIAVSISKAYWGLGLGRHMMEICMDWAKGRQIEVIELLVETENIRALRLYLGLGFKINGLLPRHWKNARGEYQDVYAMSKFLL